MAWLAQLGTLAWNYRNHRTGKWPTMCTLARKLPRPVLMSLLSVIFTGLAVHLWRGYDD